MPKYKVGDILYDTIPTRNSILGTIVSLKEDSYVLILGNKYANLTYTKGTRVTLTFKYIDTDSQIRVATKAEKVLYGG